MPAAIAHRAFALRLLGKDCPLGVLLGTEGPDPFMAYGMNPFRKKKDKDAVNPIGSLMHNTRLAAVYAPMLAYAASIPEEKTRTLLLDYMEGLLYHFVLDRKVHPYVFYRTGFDEFGKYGGIAVFYHGAFESILDRAIAEKEGLPPRSDRALPRISDEDLLTISKMWAKGFEGIAPLKETGFAESYRDFQSVMRLLVSKTGVKRKLFRLLMGKTSKAYSLCLPPSLKPYESLDVLNESHSVWKDPTTLEEYRKSVEDLSAEAASEQADVLAILEAAKRGEDTKEALTKLEANNDHDGGIYGQAKKEYRLCFKEAGIEF